MKIRRECKDYIGTHYHPSYAAGSMVGAWRNENIEAQTFENEQFDVVMSLDVTEHVFDPEAMFKEIWRTLKPGGLYISTFPVRKWQVEPMKQLARLRSDGTTEFLKEPPEYHGNPIDGNGSLVTWDYGYDIHTILASWAPYDVEISRFCSGTLGILGEYTEVVSCRKR